MPPSLTFYISHTGPYTSSHLHIARIHANIAFSGLPPRLLPSVSARTNASTSASLLQPHLHQSHLSPPAATCMPTSASSRSPSSPAPTPPSPRVTDCLRHRYNDLHQSPSPPRVLLSTVCDHPPSPTMSTSLTRDNVRDCPLAPTATTSPHRQQPACPRVPPHACHHLYVANVRTATTTSSPRLRLLCEHPYLSTHV